LEISVSNEPNAAIVDIRTRDRNLAKGLGTNADVAELLAGLPDLEEHADTVTVPQPAIGGRED
jgi:hypothetical protein